MSLSRPEIRSCCVLKSASTTKKLWRGAATWGEQVSAEREGGLGRRSLLVAAGEPTDAAAGDDDAAAGERRDVCCVPNPDVDEEDPLCSADRCGHQREREKRTIRLKGYCTAKRAARREEEIERDCP